MYIPAMTGPILGTLNRKWHHVAAQDHQYIVRIRIIDKIMVLYQPDNQHEAPSEENESAVVENLRDRFKVENNDLTRRRG